MESPESIKTKILYSFRLRRALSLVWKSGPGLTVAGLALLVLQGVIPLLSLYLMKLMVDTIAMAVESPGAGEFFRQVTIIIGLMGAVALFDVLCRSLSNLVSEAQNLLVAERVFDILHSKSIAVDLEYYENPQFYDALHRAQEEAPYRPTSIVNGLLSLGQNGISLTAMLGLLFWFHWSVPVILLVAVLPGILVRIKYSRKLFIWQRDRTSTERETQYFNWILTGEENAKEIRIFGLGSLLMRRFMELRKKLRREKLRIVTKFAVVEFAAQAGSTIAVFGTLAFIAYRAIQGSITLGDLVMFYQAFQRGLGFLRQMLNSMASLYEDNLFLSNLDEFIDLKPKVVDPPQPKPLPAEMKTGIVFDNVCFKYPNGKVTVLDDVSLNIQPGEVVALVGENGSGKTTLIKLLCRLYDPANGNITLDGVDLRQFEVEKLRREISVIFQDYAQYHMTARENIWFGNTELALDDERIVSASKNAGADDVIARLPSGYDTVLGKLFEGGEELSAGEWQKVALARAFLRDSQIIVLDEPTSALDPKAEHEVFNKFREMVKGRTAVIISHRFSTVRIADRIYVLSDGKIIESGSHEELMQLGGKYACLFETQAQYYK